MRKNSPLTTHLASVLVASLVTMGIGVFTPVSLSARQLTPAGTSQQPQQPAPRPTLVVGIFVEGLTADYINLLRNNFGKNGFNRFIENGVSIENVDFGPGIDATAATAILMTGASPGVNGIPAARVEAILYGLFMRLPDSSKAMRKFPHGPWIRTVWVMPRWLLATSSISIRTTMAC